MYKELTGLVLADIHIGAMPIEQTLSEISMLKYQLKDKYYSFIIVAGDYFDRKLYSYEKYIIIANDLFLFLLNHCDKLRMVNGTKSHDNDQYNIFKQYEEKAIYKLLDKEIDFKVINTVEEEYLFEELRVLYVPEEYVYDKREYYKNFFLEEGIYDYVFGHGVIQEAMTNAVRNMKKDSNQRKKAPVFTTAELKRICKGQVYFGHYHVNTNIDNRVFYVGSLSRYKFGEEEPKGFYEISTNGEDYKNHFVENVHAQSYVKIMYSYQDKIFSEDVDLVKELNNIKERKKASGIDHLKLIFNIPDDYPKSEFFINLVNDVFRDCDDIKVEITNGYIVTKRNTNKEEVKEVLDNYPYIFNKGVNIEDQISYFIHDKNKKDIPPNQVKKYLNFKAIDLLKGE